MAIYSHSCVHFCREGMAASLWNKEAMLTDASKKKKEKKTIIMQICDGIIMDVFIIYRFGFAFVLS